MSTHCLTYVHEGGILSRVLVCMFRHHDGYPSGHGAELAAFLNEEIDGLIISGMPGLASRLVYTFYKDHNSDEEDDIKLDAANGGNTEAYNYHVYLDEKNNLTLSYSTSWNSHVNIKIPLDNDKPKYIRVGEFVYKSLGYDSKWKWRKIGIINENDGGFLTGYDLNDDEKFKQFRVSSILDGRINYTKIEDLNIF